MADPVLADITQSKFYVNIKNELGLDYKKVRGDLLALSLSRPDFYYTLRSEVISKITENQVEQAYSVYWNILKRGFDPEGDQIQYTTAAGKKDFVPNLPEHIINQFATKVAKTIEDMAEEAVNLILPDDYLKLSQEKQKNILRAKGQLEE